ncbi:Peptidase C39 domain-containing protein [Sulfidibacter corallicola]|uniref:Peptidase C39 domain-containing protein n=1 Tax=Sulfidibacter corallicola TaxID=2818388 RepID=A0A8A4TKF5_SULCO|nr:cysteine peptidase family C39 domain-containing protein [Sulfidibacter corallicola]QTD50063.1 hypothetical protein J3U87_31145 [Sulfidibacter corallicola]
MYTFLLTLCLLVNPVTVDHPVQATVGTSPQKRLFIYLNEAQAAKPKDYAFYADIQSAAVDIRFVLRATPERLEALQREIAPVFEFSATPTPPSPEVGYQLVEGEVVVTQGPGLPSVEDVFTWAVAPLLTENRLFFQLGSDYAVLQPTKNACGVVATEMLLQRSGYPVDQDTLYDLLDFQDKPISLSTIHEAVQSLGVQANGYRGSLANLKGKEPAMLHVDHSHYVVLSKVLEKGVIVLDPAVGRAFWTHRQLEQRWHGIFFLIE